MLLILFLIAMVAVTAVLASMVEPERSTGSVLLIGALAVITLASGLLVNELPRMVLTVWRWPQAGDVGLVEAVSRLRTLWRPRRLIGVVLVAALVIAAGIRFRPAPADLESGPLVVMTAFGDSPSDARSMLRSQWNQLHDGNPAKFLPVGGETDAQHEQMVSDAKPGGAHEADIYVLDIVWLEEFIRRGYIQPLDRSVLADAVLEDFILKVREPGERDGELWALPFNTDVGLIYYRTDIGGVDRPARWQDYFGDGAKKTMAEVKEAKVPRGDEPDVEAAIAAQLADEEVLTVTALEAIWAAGGDVARDGQVLLTSDKAGVQFTPSDLLGIKRLASATKDPEIVLTEANQSMEGEVTRAFSEGRTLYMRNWPVAYNGIGPQVQFGVMAPPSPSVLGGQYLAVSANTEKPRAAHALIEFLTSPSSQLILSEVGGFAPVRNSAFENATRPYSKEVQAALNGARLRPVTPCYTQFSQVFRKGILRAMNADGEIEPEFPAELAETLKCG